MYTRSCSFFPLSFCLSIGSLSPQNLFIAFWINAHLCWTAIWLRLDLHAYANWNNHASSCNNHLKSDSHLHVMPPCYLGIKGSKISEKTLQTITSNRVFANIQKCRTHHQVLLFGECGSSTGHVFLLCGPLWFQWWTVLRAMVVVNREPLTRLLIHRWAGHLGGAMHVELVMKKTVNHRCIDM
jgi:hypothetical protein